MGAHKKGAHARYFQGKSSGKWGGISTVKTRDQAFLPLTRTNQPGPSGLGEATEIAPKNTLWPNWRFLGQLSVC